MFKDNQHFSSGYAEHDASLKVRSLKAYKGNISDCKTKLMRCGHDQILEIKIVAYRDYCL